MCGRVAPASNGGVRSHEQQLTRRLAALEDRGERWRCAVALAGIVVQLERLARANPDTPTPTHQWKEDEIYPSSKEGVGVGVSGSIGDDPPPEKSEIVLSLLDTVGTYPRRTAGALGRALRVRGAIGSSRQRWPKRPISSSYRPYTAWMDAFQTLVHV